MIRFTKPFLSAASAIMLTLAAAPSAFAHAHPKTITPEPNSTVSAPKSISITYSEAVEPKFSTIKLTSADGKPVTTPAAKPVAGDAKTITLDLPALSAGTYTVNWTNVSTDGHREEGNYKFSVK